MNVRPKHEQINPDEDIRIAGKQLHVLCFEHHIKMRMTWVVTQTEYACPEPDCGVRYSTSNGYFIAPGRGQLESYLTPRVTCSRDGQPMYLAEINQEKRAFRLWRCPQCDSSRTNEEGLVNQISP